MAQWAAIKHDPAHEGHLVLFQLGQFMEAFHEDAVTLANVLNIVLTQRGTHRSAPVPMAGIPMHSRDGFVSRLVRAGVRVVLCEQQGVSGGRDGVVEGSGGAPSSAAGLMPRVVTQVITPGTWLGDATLAASAQQRWLWSVVPVAAADGLLSAAWVDVSTGQLHVAGRCSWSDLVAHMSAHPPAEIVIDPRHLPAPPSPHGGEDEERRLALQLVGGAAGGPGAARRGAAVAEVPGCDDASPITAWPSAPQQASWPLAPAFATMASSGAASGGALPLLLRYVSWTMRSAPPLLQEPVTHASPGELDAPPRDLPAAQPPAPKLWVDSAARRSLELTRPQHGRRRGRGSLLHAIDCTVTAAGSRLLDSRLAAPLTCVHTIQQRQDAVTAFLGEGATLRIELRRLLATWPDVDRCLQRVCTRWQPAAAGGDGDAGSSPPAGAPPAAAAQPMSLIRDLLHLRHAFRVARRVAVLLVARSLHVPQPPSPEALAAATALLQHAGAWRGAAAAGLQAAVLLDDAPQPGAVTLPPPAHAAGGHLPVVVANSAAWCGVVALADTSAPTTAHDALSPRALHDASPVHAAHAAAFLLEGALLETPGPLSTAADAATAGTSPKLASSRRGVGAPSAPSAAAPSAGGFAIVRPGFSDALDHARELRDGLHGSVTALQDELRRATGVRQLRVKHTDEHGWVVEAPTAAAAALESAGATWRLPASLPVPLSATPPPVSPVAFHRVRTLKSSVRLKVPVLQEADRATHSSAAHADSVEAGIVEAMCRRIVAAAPALVALARAVAVLDVAASHAELAHRLGLVRPAVHPPGSPPQYHLRVSAARHVVVERALMEGWAGAAPLEADSKEDGGSGVGEGVPADAPPQQHVSPRAFVPNDIAVGGRGCARLLVLTGANMGGKSTWLRSAAHIVLLAHMGCYVPASAASMTVTDGVFARIGASDDLSRDRSTFLVEMAEMAAVVRGATAASLVIIDELGRGTSSVDGLAIAWSCLRHLADVTRCRTLFATHMHELVPLAVGTYGTADGGEAAAIPPVACMAMEVAWVGDAPGERAPALTHRIIPVDVRRVTEWIAAVRRAHAAAPIAHNPIVAGVQLPSLGWNDSLGIHIARQAGLPPTITHAAHALACSLYDSGAAAAVAAVALRHHDQHAAAQPT